MKIVLNAVCVCVCVCIVKGVGDSNISIKFESHPSGKSLYVFHLAPLLLPVVLHKLRAEAKSFRKMCDYSILFILPVQQATLYPVDRQRIK